MGGTFPVQNALRATLGQIYWGRSSWKFRTFPKWWLFLFSENPGDDIPGEAEDAGGLRDGGPVGPGEK